MSQLLDKLKKASTIKESDIIEDSTFFNDKEMVPTSVYMFNVALSARLFGGFVPGLTTIAGASKHFKTNFGLLMMKSFLDKYEDGVAIFYDTEFGTPPAYLEAFGIDQSRILHTPIKDVEQLKADAAKQLNELQRGEKVFFFVDSIGNLASRKEIEDALEQNFKVDMTRAKQIKSLFRIVTPYLTMKDVPMVVIGHTYDTQEMYSKAIVSGGKGIYYSSDTIFIIGRQQEKEGTEVIGYNFIINVEKSRYVKEKSKIPVSVTYEDGIEPYSGLLEIATELGFVVKPSKGWYCRAGEDEKYREDDTKNLDFWKPILENPAFDEAITAKYAVSHGKLVKAADDE